MIEMIVFIVVVSVAMAGIFSVLNITTAKSADPMIRKNMLSIGEALLEEVELMPFTFCDPSPADASQAWATALSTATGTQGCNAAAPGNAQGLGPANGEVRVSTTNPFNNVGDYSGGGAGVIISGTAAGLGTFGSGATAITDISGSFSAPPGYYATISLTPEALGGIASSSPPATMNVLRITVTVYYGANLIVLEGYRARYWPNNLPW